MLIAAAIDGDRDGLKKLWAKLLAALMDPAQSGFFCGAFVDVAKRMDPLDAQVLQATTAHGGDITGQTTKPNRLGATRDEVDVSVANLGKLELVGLAHPPDGAIAPFWARVSARRQVNDRSGRNVAVPHAGIGLGRCRGRSSYPK